MPAASIGRRLTDDGEVSKRRQPDPTLRRANIAVMQPSDTEIRRSGAPNKVYENGRRVTDFSEGSDGDLVGRGYHTVAEFGRRSGGSTTPWEKLTGAYTHHERHFGPRQTHPGWAWSHYRPLLARPRVRGGLAAAAVGGAAAARHRRQVSKSLPPVGGILRRIAPGGVHDLAFPAKVAAVTGGAAGGVALHRRNHPAAGGAAVGGSASEAAYLGAGLGYLQRKGKQLERPHEGQSRSAYQKLVRDHKYAHGVGGMQGPQLRTALKKHPDYFRQYPKTLGGWRYKRALGHLSGRRGMAIEAGVVGAGALAGAKAGSHRPVSKGFISSKTRDLKYALKPSSLARHPRFLAYTGAGAAAGTSSVAAHRKPPQQRSQRQSLARNVVAGGVAGQAAYQGAGYVASEGTKSRVGWYKRLSEVDGEEHGRIKAEQKLRKTWRHEVARNTGRNVTWTRDAKTAYRQFPLEHRGARTLRTVAWTHAGRSGQALGAASTVAGAALGARHHHRSVNKALTPRAALSVGLAGTGSSTGTRTIAKRHTAETAAGVGLLGYANRAQIGQAVDAGMRRDPQLGRLVNDVKISTRAARGALSPYVVHHGRVLADIIEHSPLTRGRTRASLAGALLIAHGRRRR